MIIAHLPSGYILGRTLATSGLVFWAALLGGVLPDFDMFWFYFVDNRAVHHHHYWVHIPGFWVVIAVFCLPLVRVFYPSAMRPALAFLAAIFLHLILDTIAGDIKWLWPMSDQFFHLIEIPARYSHWVLNFILHPVFLVELAVCAVAGWMWWRRPAS